MMLVRAIRQTVAFIIGLAAVVLPGWAMFHLVRQGSCGDIGQPSCPDEVGYWIGGLVIAGTILAPAAITIAGRDRVTGQNLLLAPILILAPLSFVAGIVVSLLGTSSNPDSQWIGFVLGGLAVLVVIRVIVGVVRRLTTSVALPKLTAHPVDTAHMQQLAATLQQVQATREPVAPPAPKPPPTPDPEIAARLRKLDELRESGLIDEAEHRRRRDEILAEI